MESVPQESTALTSREVQVLWWLAQGCTYSRIGDRLGVSLHTVTTHIKNIYRKLEVHCAAAAVRRAIERGCLVEPTLRGEKVA